MRFSTESLRISLGEEASIGRTYSPLVTSAHYAEHA